MAGEYVRACLVRVRQQVVEVGREGDAILRACHRLAPAAASEVVHTDTRIAGNGWRNPTPRRRERARPGEEHDGGATGARAMKVESMAADVDQLPGHRKGAAIRCLLRDLVQAADAR